VHWTKAALPRALLRRAQLSRPVVAAGWSATMMPMPSMCRLRRLAV
jgi:hypothetical protein